MPEQPPPFARGIVGRVDPFLHVAPGLRQHLPHLARHLAGKLFLPRNHQVADLPQDVAPLRRRDQPPLLEGRPGRLHRFVHVLLPRSGERADDLVPVGGIPVLECLARPGINPLPVDEILKFLWHEPFLFALDSCQADPLENVVHIANALLEIEELVQLPRRSTPL